MLLLGHYYNIGVPAHLQKFLDWVIYEGQHFVRVQIDIFHLGEWNHNLLLGRRHY